MKNGLIFITLALLFATDGSCLAAGATQARAGQCGKAANERGNDQRHDRQQQRDALTATKEKTGEARFNLAYDNEAGLKAKFGGAIRNSTRLRLARQCLASVEVMLVAALRPGARVIVDGSQVTYMSAAGVRTFASVLHKAALILALLAAGMPASASGCGPRPQSPASRARGPLRSGRHCWFRAGC